jgi:cytochrome b6-f complex iron-sulfur subunit
MERKSILGIGTVFVLAILALSGCMSDGGQTPSAPPTEPSATAPSGQFIAKTADVPPGATKDFMYNSEKSTLVNFNGNYLAFVNKCPHRGATNIGLSGDVLKCPLHGSTFSPADGKVLTGPAVKDLTTIEVVVKADSVYTK